MKKTTTLKTLAAAALTILAASCAKEQLAENGGQAGVSFTVEVPGAPATKAIGDGTTAKTLYYQVFDKQGEPISKLGAQTTTFGVDGKAKVNFQLVKDQTYNFIFWAQTNESGYYTIGGTEEEKDLRTITANYDGKKANDENFDAFFAVEKALKISGPVTKNITLKRPFAQINIGTKGTITAGEAFRDIVFTGAKSTVTVTDVPTVFSPLATADAQLGTPATVTFDTANAPEGDIKVNDVNYKYLAMNYVFASETGAVTDIAATLTVEDKNVPLNVPNAPIKRNWRTNIVGNLLTAEAGFDVVIDPNFDDDEDIDLENIKNEASLKALFTNGGTATLQNDIDLSARINVMPGEKVVLNLNGKAIKNTTKNEGVVVYGELTFEGDGVIDGGEGGSNIALCVLSGGKVTINGGYFTVGGDENNRGNACIYSLGGDVIINGGYFRSECQYEGKYYVLNQNNSTHGKITVYGGQFENYDPSTGDDNLGGNFVADGYTTKASYDKNAGATLYSVVKVTASATDEATLSAALSSKNRAVISVSNNLDVNDVITVEKSVTLNLNGSTLNCIDPEALRVNSGGSLNITGKGTIVATNAAPTKQTSAVVIRNGGAVNIYDGVTLDGGSGSKGNYAVRLIRGTVNIYGGYFHSGNDKDGISGEVIYMESEYRASSRAYLNIYGGVFECDGDAKYLINMQDAYRSKCNAKIYGGTFVGFDPSNVNEGTITTFVASGYKSVETTYNGKQAWKVVKE